MEIRNKWIVVIVAVLFALGFMKIIRDLRRGDWGGQPSIPELALANSELTLPPETKNEEYSAFSKLTFMAAIVRADSTLAIEEVADHFKNLAIILKWTPKIDRVKGGDRKMVFCSGRLSRVIEIMPSKDGARIRAGTYWESEKNNENYCPPLRGGRVL